MAEPSANPNAFSAPAEGFGQTVSFAFDPAGAPPTKQATTSRGPSVNSSGVSNPRGSTFTPVSTSFQAEPVKADPTVELLMKAGADILQKKVDEARTEQFVAGMQRAMTGEAVVEIKESQPWWAKVFGDTPMIEGARAYESQTRVNKAVATETANVTKVQHLDADAAAKHYANVLRGTSSGDSGTDALVVKGMTDALPGLMKAQAKAHYAWGQNKAMNLLGESMNTGARSLQEAGQLFSEDKLTPADMALRAQQFVASALPPEGIDQESYQKVMSNNLLEMSRNGQFHAVNALKESGVFRALTPEQSNRVDAAIQAGGKLNRDNYAFASAVELGALKSDAEEPEAGKTPRDIANRVDAMNDRYKRLTGSPVPLITSDEKAQLLKQNFNAIKQEQAKVTAYQETQADKARTATEKAAAREAELEAVRRFVANGDVGGAKRAGLKSDDLDNAVFDMASKNLPAALPALRIMQERGYVSRQVQDLINEPWNVAQNAHKPGTIGAPPNEFFQTVDLYRKMETTQGSAFAQQYFGENAKKIAWASRLLGPQVINDSSAVVYNTVMSGDVGRTPKLSPKESAAVVKKITKLGSSVLPGVMGGYDLRPDAAERLGTIAEKSYQAWRDTGMNDEEAWKRALNDTVGPDEEGLRGNAGSGEVIGGYFITRNVGATGATLGELMKGGGNSPVTEIPNDLINPIFEQFMSDPAGVAIPVDVSTGSTMILRLADDPTGNPKFQVSVVGKNGQHIPYVFSGMQLAAYAADKTHWKRKGPTGTRAVGDDEAQAYYDDQKRRSATQWTAPALRYGPDPTYNADNWRKAQDMLTKQVEALRKQQPK